MFDLTFEMLFVFLLVIINGFFATSETAIVTARKSRASGLDKVLVSPVEPGSLHPGKG